MLTHLNIRICINICACGMYAYKYVKLLICYMDISVNIYVYLPVSISTYLPNQSNTSIYLSIDLLVYLSNYLIQPAIHLFII